LIRTVARIALDEERAGLDSDYAMRNNAGARSVEHDIANVNLGWAHRLYRDDLPFANRGKHARSARAKPQTAAATQKICRQAKEQIGLRHADG